VSLENGNHYNRWLSLMRGMTLKFVVSASGNDPVTVAASFGTSLQLQLPSSHNFQE
jgi:hypothetical protein